MAQNALLFSNISKQNKTSNLTTDIINLNKINNISFGGIGEWKKWKSKNLLYASLLDLQGYTVTNGLLATIQPSVSILANNIMLFCGYMKDKFCNNYKDQEAKEKLEIPPTVPVTLTTILSAAETASTNDAIKTAVTTTVSSGFNLAVGAVSGIITKLSEDATARSALTVFIMEAYGGAVIYYLEKRRNNPSDGEPGNEEPLKETEKLLGDDEKFNKFVKDIGLDFFLFISPELASSINNPEAVERFFENLDMKKLENFHTLYEKYTQIYLPTEMDIKETITIKLDKNAKKFVIYDALENKELPSVINIPIQTEKQKQTVHESTYTQKYSTPSYSYKQYNYNSNRYNQNQGGMLC